MFGIGGFELFIILLFGFIIFGPDKLPDIAKTVGRGIARFREAQQEMNETLGTDKLIDLNDPDEPFKNPIDALDKLAQRQEEKKAEASASGNGGKEGKAVDSGKAADGQPVEEKRTRPESFTERKARYERERAARKAAEAAEAEGGSGTEGAEGANSDSPGIAPEPEADAQPASDSETEPAMGHMTGSAEGSEVDPIAETPASDCTDAAAGPSEGGDE